MGVYLWNRLPSAYQEVEYIQSSGTQYFILWNQFKTSYKSVIDLQMVITWGDYVPLGIRDTSYRYWIDVWWGYFTIISGGSSWTNTVAEDTNRHSITIDKTTAIVDGNNYSISYIDRTINYWLGVFCYNDIWSAGYMASMKMYKLDIYDENWTLIYNLVPCYRKLDTEIWMYDMVNGVFYTNSWTWTFTKWQDTNYIEYELKNAYIGEYVNEWTPDASRTLLYLKLENNVTDSSWNSVSVNSSGISYWTAGDKYYAQLTSTSGYIRPTATLAQQIWTWDFTVSFFMYLVSNSTWEASWMFWDWYDSWSPRPWICIRVYTDWDFAWMDDWNGANQVKTPCSKNTWHYQTYVRKNWVCYCYLDGAFVWQHNHSWNLASPWVNKFYILNRSDYSPQRWSSTWARISEVIFENVAWTADDVQNYYNSTKSNYWL